MHAHNYGQTTWKHNAFGPIYWMDRCIIMQELGFCMGSVCHSCSHPGPITFTPALTAVSLLSSAVFTDGYLYRLSPISFGILPVKEGHDVESSTVSRPTAAACNVTAATLQDRDYARFTPGPAGLSQWSPTPGSPETLAGLLPLPFPCKTLARTV